MGLETDIRARLTEAFGPSELVVENQSSRHAGHAGDDGSGESHWHVVIAAAQFKDMSRIARHKAVHAALGDKIMGRIHALSMDLKVP